MISKKILIILIFILFATNSNAKTIGNYLSLDFINSELSFGPEFIKTDNTVIKSKQTNSSSAKSFGFRYNYAINLNNFFLAPGLFFENNNIENNLNQISLNNIVKWKFNDARSFSSKIKKRYGAKINFGYDFNEDLSIYLSYGKAYNYITNYLTPYEDYASPNVDFLIFYSEPVFKAKYKKLKSFYGAGIKVKINDDWYIDSEFNYSRIITSFKKDFKTLDYYFWNYGEGGSIEPIAPVINHDIILKVIKIGISYNF